MVAQAHATQVVVAEYADGWLYCRTRSASARREVEGAPAQLPCPESSSYVGVPRADALQSPRAATVRHDKYWFNARTAESRWTAPPSLARLDKSSSCGATRSLQQPPPRTPKTPSMTPAGSVDEVGHMVSPRSRAGYVHLVHDESTVTLRRPGSAAAAAAFGDKGERSPRSALAPARKLYRPSNRGRCSPRSSYSTLICQSGSYGSVRSEKGQGRDEVLVSPRRRRLPLHVGVG